MYGLDFDSVYMKNDCRRHQVLEDTALGLSVAVCEPGLFVLCRRNKRKTVVGMWNTGSDIALAQDAIRLDSPHATVRSIGPLSDGGALSICENTVNFSSEIPPSALAALSPRVGGYLNDMYKNIDTPVIDDCRK